MGSFKTHCFCPSLFALFIYGRVCQAQESFTPPVVDGGTHEAILMPLDQYRENDLNATRAGIVDLFQMPQGDQDVQLGLCHIAFFNMFSFVFPGSPRMPVHFMDLVVSGFAAAHLAIQMLNTGDGSVIEEIQNLNQKCPIRFTIEAFDTGVNPNVAADAIQEVLQRTTPEDREVCAVMGGGGTRTTIPMAFLTALENRPQLTPMATGSQLDDHQMFPLLGRLVSSDLGYMLPLVLYWKKMGVSHVGLVHWNDDHGNAVVRAINDIAARYHPDLAIVATDIPSVGATREDYASALAILERTNFRWFYASVSDEDCLNLIEQAVEKKMAGTGEFVWIFLGSILSSVADKELKRGTALAQGMQGVGFFTSKRGRPGIPVFDKFVQALKKLDNPSDVALLNSRMVRYPDEPDFPPPMARREAFAQDPSAFASIVFDSTIMFGLSACKAAAVSQEENEQAIYVDGSSMFQNIVGTSFEGATGNVTLDPGTGTRLPETEVYIMVNLVNEDVNETHVKLSPTDSEAYLSGEWRTEVPYIYNDGTTVVPGDLPAIQPEVVHIGRALRILGLTLAALILFASLALALWTYFKRNDHIVRASQPVFLLLVCLGTSILGLAIIPLSIDDEIASTRTCDVACMATPWFTSIGFALIFAALFSKTWRVNRLLSTPDLRRAKLSALDVMTPLITILLADVAVLVSWTIIDPLRWERETTIEDPFARMLESRGQCTSDGYAPFLTVLVVLGGGALCLAAYQAYRARSIATEFAESDYIAKAIMCMILVSAVGVPTMILVSDDATANFFAMTSIIFVLCAAVLLFIFVPKIRASSEGEFNFKRAVEQSMACRTSTFDSDSESTGVSGIKIVSNPAMLEKYRSENSTLKKQIAELKQRITDLGGSSPATQEKKLDMYSAPTSDSSNRNQ